MKTKFTIREIKAIKDILYELRRADRDRQKAIRSKLRRTGFRIEELGEIGMTSAHVDDLIASGRIKIVPEEEYKGYMFR